MPYPIPSPPSGTPDSWAAAVEAIRGYCGWHIAPVVTEDVVLNGDGGDVLFLPTMRLVSLTAVTSDGTAATDLEWSESGMVRGHRWSSKFRGIAATMTHGHDEWPPELAALANDIVKAASREGSSMTSGPFRIEFDDPMSERRDVLDRYRLMVLP